MQLHYPDGTPFDPADSLNHFNTRVQLVRVLAECVGRPACRSADALEQLQEAVFALADDWEETLEAVRDYDGRLPPEAARPDIGGWGSVQPLRPRRLSRRVNL